MNFSEGTANILLFVALGVIIVVNIFVRRRKAGSSPLGMVVSLFSDVNKNQKLVENFSFQGKGVKRFKTGSWMRNKNKINFLPQQLQNTLAKAFEMAEEFNARIDSAKKYGSSSYMAGIDVGKLKEPLAQSKQELQEWFRENASKPEYTPKRRGLFG